MSAATPVLVPNTCRPLRRVQQPRSAFFSVENVMLRLPAAGQRACQSRCLFAPFLDTNPFSVTHQVRQPAPLSLSSP